MDPRPDLIVALTTPPFLGVLAKGLARLRRAAHAHWVMDVQQASDPAERERRGARALSYARRHFDRRVNYERLIRLLEGTKAVVSTPLPPAWEGLGRVAKPAVV